MARKRLTGPLPDYLDAAPALSAAAGPGLAGGPPDPGRRPPIAQVASEAAVLAALAEVTSELEAVMAGGRMVLSLQLDQVAVDYLIRDRIAADPADMAALKDSLRARGQQTPVDVADRGDGMQPRYGLISGWRRMLALRALAEETGEARFGEVLALVRQPGTGAGPEAYVAMVEENEIRAGLSFYERARIVMRAVEARVYPTEKKALQGLFASASPAKRSKVKSFIPVVVALDGALRFPARIPEREGLALEKALDRDPGFAAQAVAALDQAAAATPEAEAQVIAQLLRRRPLAGDLSGKDPEIIETDSEWAFSESDMRVSGRPGRVVIEGAGADAAFVARLRGWISGQG
jgi:ParB family transcriptional regulator, chromosome partitioning protein